MSTSSHSMPGTTQERIGWRSLQLPLGLTPTTLALTAIVILAAVLRFANIDAIGQSNTYYTAAIESMLQSWHNFFFVAAEPGGSVSIDKPPVGLWLEAISAYFLGVSGFAVVLPQILSGIGSVLLVFYLVRRWFGNAAGLLAALTLAVTPVAIAVERNNTPDASLIFTLLLATWAFIRATETRRLRFLVLGAVLVGIGFNIKMMQALLPLPAFYALYFFGSEQGWWRKIVHLGLATLVLIPVALSWAVIVDLTPADQRPYVGSSENNSALNLIIGYNGIQRLVGNGPGGSGAPRANNPTGDDGLTPPATTDPNAQAPFAPGDDGQFPDGGNRPAGGFGGPGGAGGSFGTGNPGVLRLFQSGLAAQVSWLLPFGLIMIVAMAASVAWWKPQTNLHRGLILWGGWLLTCAVFFSIAGFFHQYYLAMLGAPLAAIVAMGLTWLWRLHAAYPIRAAALLLVAAGVTLAFQVYAVGMYQALGWWVALPIVLAVLGLGLLLIGLRRNLGSIPRLSFALLTAALLTIPTVWSGFTTAYADTSGAMTQAYGGTGARGGFRGGPGSTFPGAPTTSTGNTPTDGGQPMDGGMGRDSVNSALLEYLQANTQDTKYLVVVPSSNQGSQYVLATGRPVLYAGGFSGGDPVIDGEDLAQLVADGEVRYVLWGGMGGRGNTGSSITSYLQSSCTVVDQAGLGLTTSTTAQTNDGRGFGGPDRASTLYQCGA
ncbi:MAG: glycosyltransferase family 39 protein [Chloroflexi bacterium]|nr:glycosyltransferase family 39 protein [Chloroflexota bacterium]